MAAVIMGAFVEAVEKWWLEHEGPFHWVKDDPDAPLYYEAGKEMPDGTVTLPQPVYLDHETPMAKFPKNGVVTTKFKDGQIHYTIKKGPDWQLQKVKMVDEFGNQSEWHTVEPGQP